MKTGINITQLKKYITKMYGKKCTEYAFGCFGCMIWKLYEEIESFYEDTTWTPRSKKDLQHRSNVEL